MSTDGQGTLRRRNIAENFNPLSRAHERYRQTDDRRTDDDIIITNVNVSSRSLKTNGRLIGILFPVSILTCVFHRHVILHPPDKFRSNRTIGGGVMTSHPICKMAAIESEMYFRVEV